MEGWPLPVSDIPATQETQSNSGHERGYSYTDKSPATRGKGKLYHEYTQVVCCIPDF